MPLWSCLSLVKQIRLGVLYYFLSLICSSLDLSRTCPPLHRFLPISPTFGIHSCLSSPFLFSCLLSFLYLLLLPPINSLFALPLHFLFILFLPHTFYSTLRHFFTSLSVCSFPPFLQRLANSKAHTSRFISANLPCNKFKNRLVNIMPYETTRVCLQPIRGLEGSDYINSSFIDGYR